jgi:hypothetical protein
MEMLRRALEVQTGKRVEFYQLDMNTRCAGIIAGEDEFEVDYDFSGTGRLHFRLEGNWYCALFEASNLVRVGCTAQVHVRKTVAGDFSMRWVGSSFVDRREEPLFLEQAAYCAQVRGMTLEELLCSSPAV